MGKIVCRGWKSICTYLDVKDPRTARKILDKRRINGRPLLQWEGTRGRGRIPLLVVREAEKVIIGNLD